jgi:hypothetical protein
MCAHLLLNPYSFKKCSGMNFGAVQRSADLLVIQQRRVKRRVRDLQLLSSTDRRFD